MRKSFLFFFVLILFVMLGCTAVKSSVDNYSACRGDSGCSALMAQNAAIAANVAKVVPFSNNDFLGMIFGSLASLVTGVVYGRKVTEKKFKNVT